MSNDGGFGYGPKSSQQLEDGHFSSTGSMVPQSKPFNAWPHVLTPAVHATASAPDHVYINSIVSGDEVSFAFFEGDTYHTLYKHTGANTHANQRLDISPVSWSGSAGTTVKFYYGGGR